MWPASSRIVWPAFTPACKPALAFALAPAPARPAARARACPFRLRRRRLPIPGADLSPALGRGLCPFRLPIPGRPRACLPRLPYSLQPFPPVSPERGGAFGFRAQTMMVAVVRTAVRTPSQTRAPAGFSPAKAAQSAAALPMRAPAKSGASDVITGAEKQSEIARETRVRARDGFFSGSAYTPPLVVLRKQRNGGCPRLSTNRKS